MTENRQIPISEIFGICSSITIIKDGANIKTTKQEKQDITDQFLKMIENGYEMPAFGVAIDGELQTQKQTGLFVEFVFNDITEYNGMTFCKLLVEVNPESSGFNIMRYIDGGYNGRCYYINLSDKTMEEFQNFVLGLESCKTTSIDS